MNGSYFQKNYPGLFATPVNQEIKIDDEIMAYHSDVIKAIKNYKG